MRLAERALRDESIPVAALARSLGYGSRVRSATPSSVSLVVHPSTIGAPYERTVRLGKQTPKMADVRGRRAIQIVPSCCSDEGE